MKIAVISDTHDNIQKTRQAIEEIKEKKIKTIIHCGDIISPFTAKLFNQKQIQFHYVKGNNDGEWNLKQTIERFGKYHGEIGEIKLKDKEIAFYHGTHEQIVENLTHSQKYDYVFRGHTHQRNKKQIENTKLVNPGGIKLPGTEEKFSYAIVDLKKDSTKFIKPTIN